VVAEVQPEPKAVPRLAAPAQPLPKPRKDDSKETKKGVTVTVRKRGQ
jgi:hypothetical protein